MKMRNVLIVTAGAVLTLVSHAEDTAKETSTSALSIETAIAEFVAACAANDAQRLSDITTPDMRLEYALEDPGTYYGIDVESLVDECSMSAEREAQLSNLHIYPTEDEQVVFVQFQTADLRTPASWKSELAIVEMQANRIARIINLAPPAEVVVTARRAAQRERTVAMQDGGR
jgi:hypothetical protein